MKCNAVFEGGGVRGIGHVGAAYVLEQAGYQMKNFVGSSAGAIVASLLAAGYTAAELKEIISEIDYTKFKHKGVLAHFGILGKAISAYTAFGVYNADYFEEWLNELLFKKGIATFGDLKNRNCKEENCNWHLQVTASDITDQRLLILPRDLTEFGIDPDKYSIAKAVRMSMSIPMFYKPFKLIGADGKAHLIVDGGLLSNYPVWLFDDDDNPSPFQTIGFKFVNTNDFSLCTCKKDPSLDFGCYIKMLIATALDGADKQHISEAGGDFARTIPISVKIKVKGEEKRIAGTDFDITPAESRLLFQNGAQAAARFLETWDYPQWMRQYQKIKVT